MPAGVLGLEDRGTLEAGNSPTSTCSTPTRSRPSTPRFENDFPNGAGRLKIGSRGYAVTLVNGAVITEQGTNTGERPGRVIREFARA